MTGCRRAYRAAGGLVLAASIALPAAPVAAWGNYAHRLTGRIAATELTPAARAATAQLFKAGAALDTPDCPLRDLADAAAWPDCVRSLEDRYAYARSWHYQNIPRCGRFDFTAACADGNCLTAQIERQLAIVADRKRTPRDRVEALAFVAHFIGDLHQPLHVSDAGDRGGNETLVAYGDNAADWFNLHRIWDRELTERALTDAPVVTPQSISAAARAAARQGRLADWTQQSWALSRSVVYGKLPTAIGSCTVPAGGRIRLGEAYYRAAAPTIRAQVERAGIRLGVVLNRALG
ncbi:MAG: S1/P1 nuclease [Polymorphobacter sp.]